MYDAILIKVGTTQEEIGVFDVSHNGELQNYYDLINCDLIEFVDVLIDGEQYDLIVDEEGLLKQHKILSGASLVLKGNQVKGVNHSIVGNIIIQRHDEEFKPKSLTEEDKERIKQQIKTRIEPLTQKVMPVLLYELNTFKEGENKNVN